MTERMSEFGFGQPRGGVIQTAYLVKDIHAAMAYWVRDLKVGPWFLLEHWQGSHPVYRGRPATAAISIAMAFAGHMMIELIQPEDDDPSIYREQIERRGYGFHHIGRASDDVEADIRALEAQGYAVAARIGVPSGGEVVFLDGCPGEPGMLELIPATPQMDQLFTNFWRASIDWDGSDPVRPFG